MNWIDWGCLVLVTLMAWYFSFPLWLIILPLWLPILTYIGLRVSWIFLFSIIKLIF